MRPYRNISRWRHRVIGQLKRRMPEHHFNRLCWPAVTYAQSKRKMSTFWGKAALEIIDSSVSWISAKKVYPNNCIKPRVSAASRRNNACFCPKHFLSSRVCHWKERNSMLAKPFWIVKIIIAIQRRALDQTALPQVRIWRHLCWEWRLPSLSSSRALSKTSRIIELTYCSRATVVAHYRVIILSRAENSYLTLIMCPTRIAQIHN